MKNILLVLLIVAAIAVFAACEVTNETTVTETDKPETAETGKSTEEVKQEMIEGFDTENVVLSFWVLSDVHYGYLDQDSKLRTSLEFINSNSPYGNDLILVAGDILNSQKTTEVTGFRDAFDAVISSDIPVFGCLGPTHDIGESYESDTASTRGRRIIYKKLSDRFTMIDDEPQEELYWGRRHAVINGYHFFAVDGEGYALTDESKEWLRERLEAVTKAEPDKTVFVTGHLEQFGEVCSDFPQVVYFSGHTHIPFNTGDAIKQTSFTSVHVGGMAYFRQKSRTSSNYLDFDQTTASYAQGYRVDVDKNGCICLSRADFYYGEFIKEKWVIPAVNDENHLKVYPDKRREGSAPCFSGNAKIQIQRVENHPSTVVILFDAAELNSSEPVTQYIVNLYGIGADGKETFIQNKEISSLYMLYPDPAEMPKEYSVMFEDVGTNIKLKATVTAYDCWSAGTNSISAELN